MAILTYTVFQTFSLSKFYFMKNSFDMSIILFSIPHPCILSHNTKGMYKMIFYVEDNGNVRLENRITDAMPQNIFLRAKREAHFFPYHYRLLLSRGEQD